MVFIVGGLNLALCLFFIQLGTIAAAEFKCDQDGLYGNPENCLKFIICAHGERQDFDCPQGTSWHADRGICDTTDLSKCTATGTGASTGGSEDVFKQHLLSLLADFKPCHAGETTPASGTTVGGSSPNPGPGGNGTTTPPSGTTIPGGDGGSPATTPGTAVPGGSSPIPEGTSPNPGQGNGSTPGPGTGDGSSTPVATTAPPPTCPACPIPTEKTCPPAASCPACSTQFSLTCPPTATCPPVPSCPASEPAPKCPDPSTPKSESYQGTATSLSIPATCPDGWKYFNSTDSCYFIGKESLNATEAQKTCRSQGGDLASVHSNAENTLIYEYTRSIITSTPGKLIWIGSYRTGPDAANFANYDGTPMDYTHWRPTTPDNYEGVQYCTAMYVTLPSGNTLWDDANCAVEHVYVCKKTANKIE